MLQAPMKEIEPILPNNLKEYRIRRLISVETLARAIGRAPRTIWEWQKGDYVPKLDNALRLSAALMVPVEVLFLDRFKYREAGMHERIRMLQDRRPQRHKY